MRRKKKIPKWVVRQNKSAPPIRRPHLPLSLRNVKDLLFERGISLCHKTVRRRGTRLVRCLPLTSAASLRAPCEVCCRSRRRGAGEPHHRSRSYADQMTSCDCTDSIVLCFASRNMRPSKWLPQDQKDEACVHRTSRNRTRKTVSQARLFRGFLRGRFPSWNGRFDVRPWCAYRRLSP